MLSLKTSQKSTAGAAFSLGAALAMALVPSFAATAADTTVAASKIASRASASQASAARQPGWSTVQKIIQTFQSSKSFDKNDVAGHQAMAQLIDYKLIAMRSMSGASWQELTPAQRQELASTIQILVERRYYPRWKKIFGQGQVAYLSETRSKGDLMVGTTLTLGHKDDPLTWQLATENGKSRLVSLAVRDKDLLTTLRQRIQARQSKGGYPAMIAWLKGKGKIAESGVVAAGTTGGGAVPSL